MKKVKIMCRVRNTVPTGRINNTIEVMNGYYINDEIAMYRHPKTKVIFVIDLSLGLSIDNSHNTFKSVLDDEQELMAMLHKWKKEHFNTYSKLADYFEDLKERCKK